MNEAIPDILQNVTATPKAANYELYRWCDYVEMRCLVHADKRFSRDNLAEARGESREISLDASDDNDPTEITAEDGDEDFIEGFDADGDEALSAAVFRQLRWRAESFGDAWPFTLVGQYQEIALKTPLNDIHYLYLQLLLSSLLNYCPLTRRTAYTGPFEDLSFEIFKALMPAGAEVHQFGVGHGSRYTGKLYERLCKLTEDVRGKLLLDQRDFSKNNAGDGGLDLVAWHPLGDDRDQIPVSFAQCGCTASGWPDKMLEASPAKLGKKLITGHDWATYYFMPLDLTLSRDGRMHWMEWRDVNSAIVIDRLRFIRLANADELRQRNTLAISAVNEAKALRIS
jgi:hypothetical protein